MSNLVDNQGSPGPCGIGGWLVLPIIGFVGTILLTGWNQLQGLSEIDGLVAIFEAQSGPLVALKVPTALSLFAACLVILRPATVCISSCQKPRDHKISPRRITSYWRAQVLPTFG